MKEQSKEEDGLSGEHQKEKKEKLSCPVPVCSQTFCNKFSLNRHIKQSHSDVASEYTEQASSSGKCPLCDAHVRHGDSVTFHLKEAHQVNVETEKLHFDTVESKFSCCLISLIQLELIAVQFNYRGV